MSRSDRAGWTVLLDALRSTPIKLTELTQRLPPEMCVSRLGGEGWSVCENLGHMCAVEPPYLARLMRIILEDNPRIAAIDDWVAGGYDPETPIQVLLDIFASLRAQTMAFLEGISLDARTRPAVHAESGPATFQSQLETLLAHDQDHLAIIAARVAQTDSSPGAEE